MTSASSGIADACRSTSSPNASKSPGLRTLDRYSADAGFGMASPRGGGDDVRDLPCHAKASRVIRAPATRRSKASTAPARPVPALLERLAEEEVAGSSPRDGPAVEIRVPRARRCATVAG